jgi:hypothetical protein
MFYKYKVGWYDSYQDKEEYSEGIVCANDYGTAANRVIYSYGKDTVFNLFLEEIIVNDDEDYCLSKEDLESTFKED